ncbi:DegT/DnrJ/EryC1/StrS family aminotransferase [Paenibacillus radicis (ex Xue et al. 2023)]|uniref:DegT/DnrJ/EryC1/StrS family aminotransferase n=1 Tax=Paenibacillus radicis (ex Xue et al. 2023) TaxID=2972489 RepID=A0ABT1YK78_9BACL|nr:DegT/DnrJ/EryC1/StrS family aminotransferase [Paenibacillus radicis (ex Xue et al. 2023)]MCR8632385.1 DegT/DnrJ/EryC1/StrS family aminotransferase [Paenibacillus radicis (ex Xue et al. 2023)]
MIPLVAPRMEDDDIQIFRLYHGPQEKLTQYVQQFEEKFLTYIGKKYALAVNSGTSALHLALLGLEIVPGDEVIIPSYTCTALLNAILYVQAIPILVDCEFDVSNSLYTLSVEKVKHCITSKSKAIIFPHMFGKATVIEPYLQFGLPVIEDGTLSLGAVDVYGSRVGSKGTLSIFSVHESKMISAISGGILLTDDEKIFFRMKDYLENSDHEKVYSVRYNYTLPSINAALGINQLGKIDSFIHRRRYLANYYSQRLSSYECIELPKVTEDNVFFRFMIRLKNGIRPEDVLKYGESKGIQFGRGVYPPLHRYLNQDQDLFLNSEAAVQSVISIPTHPSIANNEAEYIMDVLEELLQNRKSGELV